MEKSAVLIHSTHHHNNRHKHVLMLLLPSIVFALTLALVIHLQVVRGERSPYQVLSASHEEE